ncbi:MAG: hypothetical protein R3F16_04545 [Myxococcota bacterium]|nr:DUF1214 domain-containing protein [Myxococcales bacterium]
MSESRKALHELIDLLREVDQRYLGPEWNLNTDADVAEGTRAVMHMLQGGLASHFEDDPDHPTFRKIVSPTRKFTGDNPDAIYFEAPVRDGLVYRVRGNMAGAVYVSITVETGPRDGTMGTGTCGVINDTMFDVAKDGSFEITLGGPEQPRNWLSLAENANRITTRHYFEEEGTAAADDLRPVPLSIEVVGGKQKPVETPNDASIAQGIRRVAGFVRARTLGMPPMANREQPAFVSKVPNEFPKPVKPGGMGLAAFDAAYSMAPYVIGPDQALVIEGRWPECRSGYVCLWTRHQMTYDYVNRQVGLNRKQTKLESDGSFRMVIAHSDPGVPNWLDSEGRLFGIVFWRFFLPEGDIETPRAKVVPLAEVAKG